MAEEEKHEEPPEEKKEKFSETVNSLKKNEKFEHLLNYAKTNTKDTIAYVSLILGIIWLIFQPVYGGLVIGVVFGLYFAQEITDVLKNVRDIVAKEGMVKSLILGGTLLGFFIVAPMIFIGAAVVVGLRQLIASKES